MSGHPHKSMYVHQTVSVHPVKSASSHPHKHPLKSASVSSHPHKQPLKSASSYDKTPEDKRESCDELIPSSFPPGMDQAGVKCFQKAPKDKDGLIDDKSLQEILSTRGHNFSIRTVHLLMYLYTKTHARKIGPKEFADLYRELHVWKLLFQESDTDRNGKIDQSELKEALRKHLGFEVTQEVLDLLFSKFSKPAGTPRAVEYDGFIECCLTAKGLTGGFNGKANPPDPGGMAAFTYESFMLTVLPFLPGF